MPCLEIGMPRIDAVLKATLAKKLTEEFSEAAGFPADIFGIRFLEYDYGQVASGGELSTAESERPYLHMLLYCPRLKRDLKQKVVATLTSTFCAVLNRPDWKPVIHICEHPYDNVGVDGSLLSDTYEQCRSAEFYYPLPED